jgi:hypothetical protein
MPIMCDAASTALVRSGRAEGQKRRNLFCDHDQGAQKVSWASVYHDGADLRWSWPQQRANADDRYRHPIRNTFRFFSTRWPKNTAGGSSCRSWAALAIIHQSGDLKVPTYFTFSHLILPSPNPQENRWHEIREKNQELCTEKTESIRSLFSSRRPHATSKRNPAIVKSITSFSYIVNSI